MASTINANNTTGLVTTADTSGILQLQTNGTTAVTVDTSQNVGLSVTPSAWYTAGGVKTLQVGGASVLGQTIAGSAWLSNNAYLDTGGTNKYIYTGVAQRYAQDSTGFHAWYTAASGTAGNAITFTQAMTLDASGNLLVGTTTALSSAAKINAYNTAGGTGGLAIGYGSGAAANRVIYLISSNGGLYFESSANAALLNSAGAWTNASDARLKNSITDIKYGLSAVMDTQPRSYKMNDLEGEYFGFIAQELQTVLPEVVSGDPEKQLGVDYGSLVAVAFKAIQEQQAIIESLTQRITALEGAQP